MHVVQIVVFAGPRGNRAMGDLAMWTEDGTGNDLWGCGKLDGHGKPFRRVDCVLPTLASFGPGTTQSSGSHTLLCPSCVITLSRQRALELICCRAMTICAQAWASEPAWW